MIPFHDCTCDMAHIFRALDKKFPPCCEVLIRETIRNVFLNIMLDIGIALGYRGLVHSFWFCGSGGFNLSILVRLIYIFFRRKVDLRVEGKVPACAHALAYVRIADRV